VRPHCWYMCHMVRRRHIDIQVHTPADAATVYALLCDGATWPAWSPIDSFQLERAGAGQLEGPGAIRVFRKGRLIGRDQIVGLVPDRRFSYQHIAGLPVRDYHGDIDLESVGGGTRIHWHVSFVPKLPGTGWLFRRGIARFIRRSARGLAAHARTRPAQL
jgi:Polyketide cyclase / dehydrase and lipid transport